MIIHKATNCHDYSTGRDYESIRVSFENNHWVDFDPTTGEIINTGKDWSTQPTGEEIERATAAVRNAIAKQYRQEAFFVRFGDLPKGGKSTNHATGHKEAGVSVIAARQSLESGKIEILPYGASPTWLWVASRQLYEVTGRYIGRGSDGEPLLSNARIVAEIDKSDLG